MEIEKNIKLGKLFDAYGAILSQSQQDVLGEYLYYDLTGSEIAENKKISRQAVKDSLKKAIKKLEELEGRLHFVEKVETLTNEIEALRRQKEN
jgi:hypothetical protein